jgi:hypothetical protein
MEEIGIACLWPGVGSSCLVSVCYNSDASWLVQIDGNYCALCHTCGEGGFLPFSHSTVTSHSLVRSMWSSDFIFLDPLKGIWLASSLQWTLMWNKLSCPGYRHMTQISTMLGCKFWCHGFNLTCCKLYPSDCRQLKIIVLHWDISLGSIVRYMLKCHFAKYALMSE